MTDADQQKHKLECLQKWQQLEYEARQKWADYKRKRITRAQLDEWLSGLERMDRRTIKRMYAGGG